jgi:hypothetical protein
MLTSMAVLGYSSSDPVARIQNEHPSRGVPITWRPPSRSHSMWPPKNLPLKLQHVQQPRALAGDSVRCGVKVSGRMADGRAAARAGYSVCAANTFRASKSTTSPIR